MPTSLQPAFVRPLLLLAVFAGLHLNQGVGGARVPSHVDQIDVIVSAH